MILKSSSINCQNCNINQLCLPYSLNGHDMERLDQLIQRRKPLQKHANLFSNGEPLVYLYAVRSGSFKSYHQDSKGNQQITAFHLPGDIIGFDAVASETHNSYAQALETSMVCEIPFNAIEELSGNIPTLRKQIFNLMSGEICADKQLHMSLAQKNAEEKLAGFIFSLSVRYKERGFSSKEFRLSMARNEIGNYLGLTIETISRLLNKFQKDGMLEVNGKFITIVDQEKLDVLVGNIKGCA